jgi:hypothetical protein
MAKPSDFAGTLLAQFATACAKEGVEPSHLDALCARKDLLQAIPKLLRGEAELNLVRHMIDCEAYPFTPDGWKVEEHKKDKKMVWSQTSVKLHFANSQKDGNIIKGDELRKELKDESVLNANVLDYLLKNPQLIPEEWKDKAVFFWGTIYRNSDGDLCVRYLYWGDRSWNWNYGWLVNIWNSNLPALVSVS